MCYINTHPENYYKKAIHVHKTWARRCTKHIFMSTKFDPILPVAGKLQYYEQNTYHIILYIYIHNFFNIINYLLISNELLWRFLMIISQLVLWPWRFAFLLHIVIWAISLQFLIHKCFSFPYPSLNSTPICNRVLKVEISVRRFELNNVILLYDLIFVCNLINSPIY